MNKDLIIAKQKEFRKILDKHLKKNMVCLTSNELHTLFDACMEYINQSLQEQEKSVDQSGIREDDLIIDAINQYWHKAHNELQRKDLGDIERKNWEGIKIKCSEYLKSNQ